MTTKFTPEGKYHTNRDEDPYLNLLYHVLRPMAFRERLSWVQTFLPRTVVMSERLPELMHGIPFMRSQPYPRRHQGKDKQPRKRRQQ